MTKLAEGGVAAVHTFVTAGLLLMVAIGLMLAAGMSACVSLVVVAIRGLTTAVLPRRG